MINVKAFELKDLERFYPKMKYQDLKRDMEYNLKDISKTILTLTYNEDTLAIVGVSKFRPGAGELWLLPSILVDRVKIGFFKAVKGLIYGFVFPNLGYHRLEIAIREGWEKGYKWAEKLGFKKSHVCEAYDTNYINHVIYYRINHG